MPIAIIIHGGAGAIAEDDQAQACADGCRIAARAGYAVLKAGGSALDAVQAAAVVLEDDPTFNAGTGSCLTADGEVETDAALMDGASLRAGAVAALAAYRNPILVARAVMDHSPHVLLCADGAARFAREHGIASCPPSELVTSRMLARWHKERSEAISPKLGTIGAVAIDARGHVAAATSTGGISGKLHGRIGDTPVIGAGTYADDTGGAASATGHGESITRVVMSKHACDRMRAGDDADSAARSAIRELERIGAEGGIILVDRLGRVGWAFNTARMSRASIDSEGREAAGFER